MGIVIGIVLFVIAIMLTVLIDNFKKRAKESTKDLIIGIFGICIGLFFTYNYFFTDEDRVGYIVTGLFLTLFGLVLSIGVDNVVDMIFYFSNDSKVKRKLERKKAIESQEANKKLQEVKQKRIAEINVKEDEYNKTGGDYNKFNNIRKIK